MSEDILAAVHAPLDRQVTVLEDAVRRNPVVAGILDHAGQLGLRSWYLGAGCLAQTVWNQLHDHDPAHGVKDYDLVYFDPEDLTATAEFAVEAQARSLFAGVNLDVTNEARVHQWYGERFGRDIRPYRCAEHAISTWPTTTTSVGIRYEHRATVICAPFGLTDLLGMVVRPNKALIDQTVYEAKVRRWTAVWPNLSVIPWCA